MQAYTMSGNGKHFICINCARNLKGRRQAQASKESYSEDGISLGKWFWFDYFFTFKSTVFYIQQFFFFTLARLLKLDNVHQGNPK